MVRFRRGQFDQAIQALGVVLGGAQVAGVALVQQRAWETPLKARRVGRDRGREAAAPECRRRYCSVSMAVVRFDS
jgi:hypothetical protein